MTPEILGFDYSVNLAQELSTSKRRTKGEDELVAD
jgi:hypothetical protein